MAIVVSVVSVLKIVVSVVSVLKWMRACAQLYSVSFLVECRFRRQ